MGKSRMFFGWWVVIATTVLAFYAAGAYYYGFTLLIDPLMMEFNWTYLAVSVAGSLRVAEGGLLAPVVGFVIDRVDPRKLVFASGIIVAAGFIMLSQINTLGFYYGAFVVLTLGFSGCTNVVTATVVARWFQRRIGMAMGLSTIGFGLGGLLVPILSLLINAYGWRSTLIYLGIAALIIIPAMGLLLRRDPETYGQHPDGEVIHTTEEIENAVEQKKALPEIGVLSALKSRQFWFISVALALQFMGFNAVVVHIVPYLTRSGFVETSAALIASLLPVLSVPSRLIYGWFGDRYSRKWALVISYATQAVGYIAFMYVQSLPALIMFLVLFTTGFGGTYSLRPAIQREYFGTSAYGSIQGLVMSLQTIGGVAGPALVAWLVGRQGSYQLSWIIFAVVVAIAVLVTIPLKPMSLESKGSG